MRHKHSREAGTVLVLVAMSLGVLLGAAGLALDGGALYVTRQQAQAAADAAAQAGAMDMYNGTNNGLSSATSYAELNGFTASQITVSHPTCSSLSWCNGHVTLSSGDNPNLIEVTVQKTVQTTLLRALGLVSSTVSATADAAIVLAPSSSPILVIHPTLSYAFSTSGSASTQICGGPQRSIQVNSSSATSLNIGDGGIDLSHAGPLDSGGCTTGTGADFANVGNQNPHPGTISFGTTGLYISPASAIQDPLVTIAAPSQPSINGTSATYSTAGDEAAHDCPTQCTVFSPGYWSSGLSPSGFSVFRPGIYWLGSGGFSVGSNTILRMAQAAVDRSDPATGTSWTSGMMIYNSGTGTFSFGANAGKIGSNTYPTTDCPNGGNCLVGGYGNPGITTYNGILFFQSHTVASNLIHSIGGGASLSVNGIIYLSHTAANIASDGTYQFLTLSGHGGSTTLLQGGIVVDSLELGGGGSITMDLTSSSPLSVRQVALVR